MCMTDGKEVPPRHKQVGPECREEVPGDTAGLGGETAISTLTGLWPRSEPVGQRPFPAS